MNSLRILLMAALVVAIAFSADATSYFVSNSTGDDNNDGLSALTPFATLARINTMSLEPGDEVLLACGDRWRAEQLVVNAAGTALAPIVFSSYPSACTNRPKLSGAEPVVDWVVYAGPVYRADLSAGNNVGRFPLGINQVFRADQRQPCGRWPNIDSGNGGYAVVDSAPALHQLGDAQLPTGNWNGASLRIKTERWMLVNREVTATNGVMLTLNEAINCRGGTCAGWGYFLQNHLLALDQHGEWTYNDNSKYVYLVSTDGPPGDITASVVLDTDERYHGGVFLGTNAAYVEINNLDISQYFANGIGAAGSMSGDIYHDVTFFNNHIHDVDAAGVKLNTWIWSASNGRDGLRGGRNMSFSGNTIDGANHFGITGYFSEATIENNVIRNIGLIKNLGPSGMGCGTTGASCTENGDGIRIRRYLVEDSGHHNVVRNNRIERCGYNGLDIFGPYTTVEENLFLEPCFSKGDCGGVRTFGNTSLAATEVHDISLNSNFIIDSIGNVDGVKAEYRELFGMGLYIDHFSKAVTATGNTVVNATITGILFQRSTGTITNNTLYNCSSGTMYSGHVGLAGAETSISSMTGNILYGLANNAWTLAISDDGASLHASDFNAFFHPYVEKQITTDIWTGRKTFAEWQTYSGMDGHSIDNWFSLAAGNPPLSEIFINPGSDPLVVNLYEDQYLDLDQNPVQASLTLAPFTSQVLIKSGPSNLIFGDGFEAASTESWSNCSGCE